MTRDIGGENDVWVVEDVLASDRVGPVDAAEIPILTQHYR